MTELIRYAGHAFISYVHSDVDHVNRLDQVLKAAGIPVWRDTVNLWPGEDWRLKIREAITKDALAFIACFSRMSVARTRTYQNEELTLAVEQLRQRRPQDAWLIPVRFDDCDIPDWNIGAGRTLASLQCADLFGGHFNTEATRVVLAIQRILGTTNSAIGSPGNSLSRQNHKQQTDSDIRLSPQDRQSLLQELALVYRGEARTDLLLDRIGFPRQYRPSLPSGSSIHLWSEIFSEFDRGVIRNPYRQLLNAARDEYQANHAFASLGERYLG
jgi:hypothetical protein